MSITHTVSAGSASPASAGLPPPTRAVLIGAGQRGVVYSNYALDHPHLLRIVAVAEPHDGRRRALAAKFNLGPSVQFASWEQLLADREQWDQPDIMPSNPTAAEISAAAPVALIATPDAQHVLPAVAFARAGFHILLEKPMAVQPGECEAIAAAALEHPDRIFAVCHVLRYTPVNTKIRSLIASGILGEVASIQHLEPIGATHFAHSYVRGNWRSEKQATFSLMAKSCHDIDLLQFWFEAQDTPGVDESMKTRATHVSSFGSLLHFRPENKPSNASDRCVSCPAEPSCPWSAKRIYLDPLTTNPPVWPGWKPNYQALVNEVLPDVENVGLALERGPYGQCVYGGLNDVADNQVVNLRFSGGQTAAFSMVAFTSRTCERQTRVFGTRGQIECDGERVELTEFLSGKKTVFHPLTDSPEDGSARPEIGRLTGHNGADFYLMRSFVDAVRFARPELISSGAAASLASHRIVFAAERSRLAGTVETLAPPPSTASKLVGTIDGIAPRPAGEAPVQLEYMGQLAVASSSEQLH